MKIVHLSLVTRGMYLTEARETLSLWLTRKDDADPDNLKYFNPDGSRNMSSFQEDWFPCTKCLVCVIDKLSDGTEEIRLDSRGFPVFTVKNDELQEKPLVFENYNSVNSGITDMFLLVENDVCKWSVLNDLNKCLSCEQFGDLAGYGTFVEDPNL